MPMPTSSKEGVGSEHYAIDCRAYVRPNRRAVDADRPDAPNFREIPRAAQGGYQSVARYRKPRNFIWSPPSGDLPH